MQDKQFEVVKKKYQCFISSTFEDLREERAECMKAILDAGQIPAGMEYFEAGKSQKEIIEKWMDESDIIIFIIGGRYGTIDQRTGNSYLEDEFDYAIKRGKIHFSIILSDIFLQEKKMKYLQNSSSVSLYETENPGKYRIFKQKVCQDECVVYVNSIGEIIAAIIKNISDFNRDEILTGGWIKCNGNDYGEIIKLASRDRNQLLYHLVKEHLTYTSNGAEEAKIANQLCNILQKYGHSLERFITTLARSIEITLFDEYIEVQNTVNVTYKLAPNGNPQFIYNPWLYEGMESDTFEIVDFRYNHKPIDRKCIKKGKARYTANPFYVMNVIMVKFSFDNSQERHIVQYSTKYKTSYDRYFHEYVFKEFCQFFSLTVSLEDCRTLKNDREYMLKWGMFTPYQAYDRSSQNMLVHNKHKLNFNVGDLMIPGNGYIITLNSASLGVIKMRKK